MLRRMCGATLWDAAFNKVVEYCTGSGCRRAFVLKYFGESVASALCGCTCDTCKSPKKLQKKLEELRDKRAESRAGGSHMARAQRAGAGPGGGDMALEEWKSEHRLTAELPEEEEDERGGGSGDDAACSDDSISCSDDDGAVAVKRKKLKHKQPIRKVAASGQSDPEAIFAVSLLSW